MDLVADTNCFQNVLRALFMRVTCAGKSQVRAEHSASLVPSRGGMQVELEARALQLTRSCCPEGPHAACSRSSRTGSELSATGFRPIWTHGGEWA